MTRLFAYGTLMFEPVWLAVVGRSCPSFPARVQGFSAYQVLGEVYPGLAPSAPDAFVDGVLYSGLDSEALHRLDRFEGEFYCRITVEVLAKDMLLKGQAYRFKDEFVHLLTDKVWTARTFLSSGGLERFQTGYRGFEDL